jgi:hypothetical protein
MSYEDQEFRIKLRPTVTVSLTDLWKAIREVTRPEEFDSTICRHIAAYLLNGECWYPARRQLKPNPFTSSLAQLANIEWGEEPNPWQGRAELVKTVEQLIAAGAEGDAEAAIKVCKGLKDGSYVAAFLPFC